MQNNRYLKFLSFTILVVTLAFIFQIAHFFEHIAQFFVWLFGPKDVVYMTPWAVDLVDWIAGMFSGKPEFLARKIGLEILHLVGNLIFLVGIIFYFRFNKNRGVKIAFWFQLFHVFEHFILTISTLTLGYPIGFSTLFGANISVKFSVSYRIIWHFVFNLIPSFYIGKELIKNKFLLKI